MRFFVSIKRQTMQISYCGKPQYVVLPQILLLADALPHILLLADVLPQIFQLADVLPQMSRITQMVGII